MSVIKQFSLYDEKTGELISRTTRKDVEKINGGEWIVFFAKPLTKLIEQTNESATIRVYLWLASKQTFNDYVMVTRKAIIESLKISRMTCYRAIKWLVNNGYVTEVNFNGNKGFFLNPNVTTKGNKNFKEKKNKWAFEIFKSKLPDASSNASSFEISLEGDDNDFTGI